MSEKRNYNRNQTKESQLTPVSSSRNVSGNSVYNNFEIELPELGKSKKPPEDEINRANTMPAFVTNTESSIIDEDRLPTEVKQGIGFRNKGLMPQKQKKKEVKQLIPEKEVDLMNPMDDPDFAPELVYKEPLFTRLKKFLKSSDKSASFKCFFFIAYIVLGFWILVAFMLFHFGGKELSLQSLAGALDYISYNLNAEVLLHNITVSTTPKQCPYDLDLSVLGSTSGTIRGCSCSDSNSILKGTCNSDNSCVQLVAVEPEDIFVWKYVSFCESKFQPIKKLNCLASNYTPCYQGFCYNGNYCPSIDNILTFDYKIKNVTKKIGNNTYIEFVNGTVFPPIFKIEISLYGKPCFDKYSLPYFNFYYPLVPNPPTGCGRYGPDNNSFIIDNDTQLALYNVNNLSSVYQNISGYLDVMSATPVYLVGRRKIILNDTLECMNNDYSQLVDVSYYLFKYNDVTSFWMLLGLSLHTTLCFGSWIMYYFMRSELHIASQIFQKTSFQVFYLAIVILEDANFALMMFRMIYYRTVLNENKSFFKDLVDEYCFSDSQILLALNDYDNLMSETVDQLLYYCVFLNIALGGCSIFLLLGLLGGKQRGRRGRFQSRFK